MIFPELGVLFEILPYHDFGLSSGGNWSKFRATLGGPKRYLVQIPETLISCDSIWPLVSLTEIYLKFFTLILRFSQGAKYHRRIVNERDLNFSHFQRVRVFQTCGSLFPQKEDFLIVFYTDIHI